MNKKEEILGIQVSNETYDSLKQKLFEMKNIGKQAFVVAVNPEKIIKAQNDPSLKDLINSADFQIPDGVGVLIASKLKGGSITNRITGIDLMATLLEEAAQRNSRVFFYGGKPGVAEQAKDEIVSRYPGINIVGVLDGYIQDQEKIIQTINQSNAELLFVALGSPKQEEWIRANREKLTVSIFQGVGGSFDVFAGNIKRAPAFFRKFGLEWLYRLSVEPWRWKRQLALPRFLLQVLKNK